MGRPQREPLVPLTGLPQLSTRWPSDLPGKWALRVGRSHGKQSRETGAAWGGEQGQARGKRAGGGAAAPRSGGYGTSGGQLRSLGCAEARSPVRRSGRGCSPHLIGQGLTIGLQCSSTQGAQQALQASSRLSQGSSWARKGEPGHQSWTGTSTTQASRHGRHCSNAKRHPKPHLYTPGQPGASFTLLVQMIQVPPVPTSLLGTWL